MSNTVAVTRSSRYGPFRPYMLRATGGFSDVYVARDNTGRTAALKIFRSPSNDTTNSMERFRREKSILERVGSRRVARLIDADLDAVPPWIASEFIEGPTLREAVNQACRLEPGMALGVLSLLAETLDELHSRGVAHRDLNPNNIILAEEGPTLIDFGSAQLLATGQASYSHLSVGTPGYISPEQLNGEPATTASDVFAFGKLANFLVTGDAAEPLPVKMRGFSEEQYQVLRRCLNSDPHQRPSATELRGAFTSNTDPLSAIQQFEFKSPELSRVPRGRMTRVLLFLLASLLILGFLGVWRVTNQSEVSTEDLVRRLGDDYRKYSRYSDLGLENRPRPGDYGVFSSLSLPDTIEIFRERRNYSKSDFGFVDFFRLYRENIVFSDLVVYTFPSVSPPSFEELAQEKSPLLVELEGFGISISDRVSQFQSEVVYADCALDVPQRVSIDVSLRRIRHVAAAPVCVDVLDTTQVAYAIHDWYPDRNILFELTGWADIAVLDPVQVLDSIQLAKDSASLIAQPITRLGLADISAHRDQPSLIDGHDEDAAYFYANAFVEIPGNSSISLTITAPEDSPAHFSFTAYRQQSSDDLPTEVPAGRLWAVHRHQLRFDNSDSTPLVLSFEIDSADIDPPLIQVTKETPRTSNGWITARSLGLGIGTSTSSLDSEIRFMLPSGVKPEQSAQQMSSVGALEIPIGKDWHPTTSDDLALVGFREYWPVIDTELREADLPHLQVSSERFSKQVDGSDGAVWVSDPAFLSCRLPTTFTFTSIRTVEWSMFRGCEIPDALQSGQFSRQVQASMIFRFVVYDSTKSEEGDNTVIFRGSFVPGTHQDLDYLRDLISHLATTDIDLQ